MPHRNSVTQIVAALLLLSTLACGLLPSPAPTPTPTRLPQPILQTATPALQVQETLPTPLPPPTGFPTPVPPPVNTVVPNPAQPAGPQHYEDGQKVRIDHISMVTRTEGWGISGPFIFRTTDGGNSWREFTPPQSIDSPSKTKAYATFSGATHGWVVYSINDMLYEDSVVWHTADGGRTWSPSQPLLHEVYAEKMWAELRAVDETHAWLSINGVYVGAGSHYLSQFYRTTNGGASWEPLDADVGITYTGMEFADPLTGWLTWESLDPYAPGPPSFALTGDGGPSWVVWELPPPDGQPTLFEDLRHAEPYAPTYLTPSSMRLLVAAYDFFAPGPATPLPDAPHSSYLYGSEDGGMSWGMTDLPDDVFAPNYDLVFFDPLVGLLLGREIYQTSDGGGSWDHVKTVNWDGEFSFVDAEYGWAVARSGNEQALVRTVDGAQTWAEVEARVKR